MPHFAVQCAGQFGAPADGVPLPRWLLLLCAAAPHCLLAAHGPMPAWDTSVQPEEHHHSDKHACKPELSAPFDTRTFIHSNPPQASGASQLSRASAATPRSHGSGSVGMAAWELRFSDLTILRPLGEGSFARVNLGTHLNICAAVWRSSIAAPARVLSAADPRPSAPHQCNPPLLTSPTGLPGAVARERGGLQGAAGGRQHRVHLQQRGRRTGPYGCRPVLLSI